MHVYKYTSFPLCLQENIAAFDLDLDEKTLKAVDEIHMCIRNPCATD